MFLKRKLFTINFCIITQQFHINNCAVGLNIGKIQAQFHNCERDIPELLMNMDNFFTT